jgi:hypothetical protein
MKKGPIKLMLILSFLALILLTCSDDPGDAFSDPNVFCDDALCAGNEALKQKCIDAFNACIANNPDAQNDECAVAALLFCEEI